MITWTPEKDLHFSMQRALQASSLKVKDLQRQLDERKWEIIAEEVIRHLRFYNWKIERGDPKAANAGNWIGNPINQPSTFKNFDEKQK